MKTFAPTDTHGKRTLAGAAGYITTKREKDIRTGRTSFPKPKNGYADPFTYWHILDALLTVEPNEIFKVQEFSTLLEDRPVAFDNITVGRVIRDIAESLEMANARKPIDWNRYWDGTRYWVSDNTEDRVAMEHLLEDLFLLFGATPDGHSPLRRCPSLV